MLGIADGFMKVLGQGQRHKPAAALEIGIVDELVTSREEALARARAWIEEQCRQGGAQARQPWDTPGYKIPGGTPSTPKLAAVLPAFPANLRKQLKGAPMPAPRNILAAAVEGTQVDVDTALRIETRYFVELVTGQVAKNMTKAFFFDMQAIGSGASRPAGYERWTPTRVAVLGAGMMGAGIAYVCALAGWEVVLKDVSADAAAKGKEYSAGLVAKSVQRGRTTPEKGAVLLDRITPTADYAALAGCDLVIEAVFESAALKKEVFAEAAKVVAPDALLCSNTSTLPITSLADGVDRPGDFVGLHFFSPVDKMPLIEIIRGRATSDADAGQGVRRGRGPAQDPHRGQRQPRLLHQPSDQHLPQRGCGDARRGHRPADDRAGLVAGRLPGAGAAADGRAHPDTAAQDPRRGPRRGRRRVRPAPCRGGARPARGRVRPHGAKRRCRVLRVRERPPHPALARAADGAGRDEPRRRAGASWPSACWSSRRSRRSAAWRRAC